MLPPALPFFREGAGMGIVVWIVTGVVLSVIARAVSPERQAPGIVLSTALGIVGGGAGGLLILLAGREERGRIHRRVRREHHRGQRPARHRERGDGARGEDGLTAVPSPRHPPRAACGRAAALDPVLPSSGSGGASMGIIAWIVFGFVVGLIARAVVPGRQGLGFIMTTVLGIRRLADRGPGRLGARGGQRRRVHAGRLHREPARGHRPARDRERGGGTQAPDRLTPSGIRR